MKIHYDPAITSLDTIQDGEVFEILSCRRNYCYCGTPSIRRGLNAYVLNREGNYGKEIQQPLDNMFTPGSWDLRGIKVRRLT